MREALSHVLYSSTEHWQLWPKLICQLFPNRNQPKSYWLRKQTILFESRVTGGSQMLLHPRTTEELLKLLMLRHTLYHLNVISGNDLGISIFKNLLRDWNVLPSLRSSGFTRTLGRLPKCPFCGGMLENTGSICNERDGRRQGGRALL